MKISRSTIYPALTSFSVFRFLLLLQLLEWLNRYRYMCHNFIMNFPPDFHNYIGLNGLVNSFSWLTITPPNKLILGCKPLWSAKMKKNPTATTAPPGMRRRIDVSFRSHIGWNVANHANTSSRRRNWYVNETDVFETSLRRLTGTWIKPTNLRRRSDVPTGT